VNLADMRALLDDVPTDLSTVDRDVILNEGYRELATESGWTERSDVLDETVLAVCAYDAPADLHMPLALRVGNGGTTDRIFRHESDREAFYSVRTNRYDARAPGVFTIEYSDTSFELLIAPPPDDDHVGENLTLTYIYRPADLTVPADEPELPGEFHRHIVDYAKGQAYGIGKDDAELATFYSTRYSVGLERLRRLRATVRGANERDVMIESSRAAAK
jgi:hypothetical protein